MKKILLFACSALLGMSAMAQNVDVTDQYLDNAGFDESSDFITTGVCTYAKDVAANQADGASLMPVSFWSTAADGDAKAGGAFGFGSGAWLTGTGYKCPDKDADGNSDGGMLGLGGCWDGDAIYTQNLKKPLSAGTYTVEIVAYNAGTATVFGTQKFGIKTESKEYFKATTWTAGQWTTLSFNIVIDEQTDGTFYVGGAKVSGGSAASAKIFIDYVKIYKSKSLDDLMDEATEDEPSDVTKFYLQNAAVTGTDGWTNGRINSNEQYDGAPDNTYLDAWNATFNMTQKVTLKPGKYTLKAATRADASISVANIYANIANGSKNSTAITAVGNEGGELGNGWGWTTVPFLVMEEAEVTIGFYSECSGNKWAGADNFSLYYDRKIEDADFIPAARAELEGALKDLKKIDDAWMGDAAFLYPTLEATAYNEAIDAAQAVADNEDASLDDIEDQTDLVKALTLPLLNQPTDDQKFNLVLTYGGYEYDQKAVTYIANGRQDAGNYNIQYLTEANANYAQAFTMTWVEDNKYILSQIDADGVERFICTGVCYGGNTAQIRTTTEADNALLVEVRATATEGKYNLWNTEAKQFIGSQDKGFFTVNSHIDFNILEAEQISATITEARYATFVAPIDVDVPADVKAYTVSELKDDVLVLKEVKMTIEANTPVVLVGAETIAEFGYSNVNPESEEPVNAGLLYGVYKEYRAPVESYVLQNHEDVVGFYYVAPGDEPTVPANRAFLSTDGMFGRVLTFGEETAIKTIDALTSGKAEIYDLNGRQLSRLQKGINIVNGAKVLVK